MLKKEQIVFFQSILPLFLGILIYAFWRPIPFIDPAQITFPLNCNIQVPNWVKYNLPDGLWMYALLSSLFFLWRQHFSRQCIVWLVLAVCMSFLLEILQEFDIIQGTYDLKDLITYILSTIIFFITNISFKKQFVFTSKS
jgi:hypothetical protein